MALVPLATKGDNNPFHRSRAQVKDGVLCRDAADPDRGGQASAHRRSPAYAPGSRGQARQRAPAGTRVGDGGGSPADGVEETYHIADRAVRDTAKGVGEGTEKAAKMTVYYTEEGGKKVAHFLKKAAK